MEPAGPTRKRCRDPQKCVGACSSLASMSDDPLDLDVFFAQLEAQVAGETSAAEAPATTAVVERRDAPRLPVEAVGREVKLSIRGGSDAKPINLSETGLLAE